MSTKKEFLLHLFCFSTSVSTVSYSLARLAHFKKNFIYGLLLFWLCRIFISVHGLSLVAASGATL